MPPTPTLTLHPLPSCDPPVSVPRAVTMNNSNSYSNKDDIASTIGPRAMGDYPYHPYLSVPQSTYPDLVSTPGYPSTAGSYVPGTSTSLHGALTPSPASLRKEGKKPNPKSTST